MFTPITDNSMAIAGAMENGREKTWRPSRRWDLGLDVGEVSNQIQQVKSSVAGKSTAAAGTVSNGGQAQGKAKPIRNLRIVRTPVNGSQTRVSISFTPDPTDTYFQGVTVFMSQGKNTPLQVATGKTSPVTFLQDKSLATQPTQVTVQSVGSFSDSNFDSSPSDTLPILRR